MKRNQRKSLGSANDDFHLRAFMYLEGELSMESLAKLETDLADPTNAAAFVALCLLCSELTEKLTLRRQTNHV
jgi:hypothetical protein